MSQDASKKQLSATNQPWSVETDADQLMNDLFSDIDRILEGGSKLPTQPAQPEYVSLQKVIVPAASLPPALRESPELLEQLSENPGEPKVATSEDLKVGNKEEVRSPRIVEKALFSTACASLVAVVAWLVIQNKFPLPFFANGNQEVAQVSSTQEEDPFAKYMRQSLEAIDSQAKVSQEGNGAVPPGVPPGVTPYPLPSNFPVAPQGQKTLERVYIPVFPPNQNSAGAALRATPQVSPIPKPNSNPSQPQAKPAPKNQAAVKPDSTAASTTDNPPAPSNSRETPVAATTPTTPTTPTIQYKLVGVLELGNDSKAMFNIEGSQQYFGLGEDIGSSGWKLVDVANGRATIRRNGEVFSIGAGESF